MTGAGMALIKKIDVDNYFAAKRATRLGRFSPVSKPATVVIEPAKKPANAPRVIGDRTRETSTPSACSVSIPITSGSGRNRLLRPPGSWQE